MTDPTISTLGMTRFKGTERVIDAQNAASLETLFRTREYEYIHFSKGSEHYELSREHWVSGEITIYAMAKLIEWPDKVTQSNGEDGFWGTVYAGEKKHLEHWPHTGLIEKMLIFRERNSSLHDHQPPKIIFSKFGERH